MSSINKPSATTIRKELVQAGWQQGQTGSTGVDCEDCGASASGKRGWWAKVSYEYDEWKCLCRTCAYEEIHQYDDFDGESFERAMRKV